MVNRSNATKLKWICFLILFMVNISVFCIWVPARLQISEKYMRLNDVWDRCEKVIFAIMDAALNFYFIYVVKKRLIANGLQKYTRLYQMNLALVVVSITLDVSFQFTGPCFPTCRANGIQILLICMMSLPNSFVYIQFHPLVYLLKLHIEMNMADLIGKVVRASNNDISGDYSSRSRTANTRSNPTRFHNTLASAHHRTRIEIGEEDEMELKERENLEGIKRTVVTEITHSGPSGDDDEVPEEHHEGCQRGQLD